MRIALLAPALLAFGACSVLEPEDTFNEGEAEAFTEQLGTAFANGMESSGQMAAAIGEEAPGTDVVWPWSSLDGPAAVQVNVSVQQRTSCTAGGYIEVHGDMTGNIDNSGSGVLFLQVLETISDWECVGDRVINGDPYISASGHFNFLNGAMSSTATISFGGGFKWGTGSKQGCNLTLTMLMHTDYTGSLSGVVCEHPVYVTF